jgi:hypothetical protein
MPLHARELATEASVAIRSVGLGGHQMKLGLILFVYAVLLQSPAFSEPTSPEVDACKASGLIALKQRTPQIKDVQIDLDSAKIISADTRIEEVPVKTVVIGDAYVERGKTDKPKTFVCIIGEKGKVLLTLFSDK